METKKNTNIFEQSNQQEEALRSLAVGIQPVSFSETVSAGWKNSLNNLPTEDYIRSKLDKNIMKLKNSDILKEFSDVPESVFANEDMSYFRAKMLADKYRTQTYYNGLKEYRDPTFPVVYDFISSLPILADPGVMAATILGNVVTGAGAVASIAGRYGAAGVLGAEFAGNLAGGLAIEYPLRKMNEEFTKQKYTLGEVFLEASAGAALATGLKYAGKGIANAVNTDSAYMGSIAKEFKDFINKKKFKSASDAKLADAFESGDAFIKQATEFSVKGEALAESYSELIQNNAFNYRSNIKDNAPRTSLFGVKKGGSEIHMAATAPLEGTVTLSSTGDAVRGTAKSVNGSGDLFFVDAANLRLVDEESILTYMVNAKESLGFGDIKSLDELTPDQWAKVSKVFKEAGFDGVTRRINATNKLMETDAPPFTVSIFKEKYKELIKGDIGPLEFNKELGYNDLNFNSKGTDIFETTSAFKSASGEGKMSNGEAIQLEATGYFLSDPMRSADEALEYSKVFSDEEVANIQKAQQDLGSEQSIIKTIDGTNDIINNLERDIKLQQDLDQAYNEYLGKDMPNKPSRFKKLADKIEKLKENIKNNSPETIEKMAKAFANCIKRF